MASAFALSGALTGRRAAAACPPVAVVEGAVGIARSVRSLLRAHGLWADPGSCPDSVVRASLRAEPGSMTYTLHIEDPFGRTSDRRVSDAETAASLIESWAIPEADQVTSPRPIHASAAPIAQDISALAEDRFIPWRLAGALEVSVGSDGSFWYGGTMTGCIPLGAVCVGGRARIARDEGIAGSNADGGDLSRTSATVMILAALPLMADRITFMPTLGLGAGWTHTEILLPGTDLDPVATESLAVHLEAAAIAALAISRHLSLTGEVSASLGRRLASSAPSSGGGLVVAPPAGFLRVGIGCQYSP